MPVSNLEIAGILIRLADLLEIDDANPFRVRAYRKAARTLESLPRSAASMLSEGADLSDLPGIGTDLADKIDEIIKTRHLTVLDEMESRLLSALAELRRFPGLGPKRVKALYERLNIKNLEDLARATEAGKLHDLSGFGRKIEEALLQAIRRRRQSDKRLSLLAAEQVAEPLLGYLKKVDGVREVIVAGSYRRRKETVGDLDILVTCRGKSKVMDRFIVYEESGKVLSHGQTRSTVALRSGLHVDLRVVPEHSYGAALHYFTGSKAHTIAVRTLAVRKGLKLNEYGIFRGVKPVSGRTEQEVYKSVGLPYIEPELREERGEIEAAKQHRLPNLLTVNDIRGDLHTHTKATDGLSTIKEMAEAARRKVMSIWRSRITPSMWRSRMVWMSLA